MFLRELSMLSFRPFDSALAKFSPHANIFFGGNGKGKTSVLEAVNLLSCGRSFRTAETKKLVRRGARGLTVTGVISIPESSASSERGMRIGVECSSLGGRVRLRLNGEDSLREEQARVFPVQFLDSEALSLISGPPEGRRKFIDWLLFHVEPEFFPEWRRYSAALKQRNSALKSGAVCQGSTDPWIKILAETGESISRAREAMIRHMQMILDSCEECRDLLEFSSESVRLEMVSGWDAGISLNLALSQSAARDIFRGSTSVGPHRGDIKIWIGNSLAEDVCSRGQLKRLMSALFISRSQAFFSLTGKRCVCLIDDILAELDESSFLVFLKGALNYSGQMFITCLNLECFLKVWGVLKGNDLLKDWAEKSSWFHVEQGALEELNKNVLLQKTTLQLEEEIFIGRTDIEV